MIRLSLLLTVALLTGGPFDAAHEDMQQRIARSRFEPFAGAGYALFVDPAEGLNAILDAFLETIGTRR